MNSLDENMIVEEDVCSICLEPFTSLDPSFVTKCQHEYHLQCVLEWSQRSTECPSCLQHLVLNDHDSQEMIAAERENELRQKPAVNQQNEHRVATITRRRRRVSAPRDDSSPPTDSSSSSRSTRNSGSLKSKLSSASMRYRESLSKGTRNLKEKIMARKKAGIARIASLIAPRRARQCTTSSSSSLPASD